MFVLVIYQINYQITRINGHVQKLSYLVQLPDPEGMSSARLRRLRLQKKVCHGLSSFAHRLASPRAMGRRRWRHWRKRSRTRSSVLACG